MPARRQISAMTPAPVVRQGDPGGIVEVRNRVEQLDPAAGRPTGLDRGDECLGDQPVVVHRDVHDLGLVGLEGAERTDVRRRLGQDDVARVAEDPGGQVQRHLRADGDHHVVRVGLDALERHHLADLLPELRDALARPVLQGDQAVLGDQAGGLRGQRLQRQRLQIRHATGQRHHLGTVGDGEQCPDGRGPHADGTLRVTLHVLVQAVARHDSTSSPRRCHPVSGQDHDPVRRRNGRGHRNRHVLHRSGSGCGATRGPASRGRPILMTTTGSRPGSKGRETAPDRPAARMHR